MSTGSLTPIKPTHLEFFSPAPVGNPIHLMDVAPVNLLNRYHGRITASWRAVPLPDELHVIDKLPLKEKMHSLPIVTCVDFMTARLGEGPDWHGYERPFKDLKFVATINIVGFGISTFDHSIDNFNKLEGKTIGVVPRPSTFRVLSDALLRDGWGIYNQVILKEGYYPEIKKALLDGEVDATLWNSVWEIEGGFRCLDIGILHEAPTHWIGLSLEDVERINKKNPWDLHRMLLPAGSIVSAGPELDPPRDVGLAGLSLAICAWDSTEEDVVYELVYFLDKMAHMWPDHTDGCPLNLARMARFPGISEELIHPGALAYYIERGITPEEPVQLSLREEVYKGK